MTNETPICLSITGNANTKNEIQIRFSKWCENETRKTKFKSVFQSDAKTKHEKRNSNPFFNVTNRQKTKNRNGNGIPFYKAEEKRKIKWNLNSIFLCHRKTVGTRVHALIIPFFGCSKILGEAGKQEILQKCTENSRSLIVFRTDIFRNWRWVPLQEERSRNCLLWIRFSKGHLLSKLTFRAT